MISISKGDVSVRQMEMPAEVGVEAAAIPRDSASEVDLDLPRGSGAALLFRTLARGHHLQCNIPPPLGLQEASCLALDLKAYLHFQYLPLLLLNTKANGHLPRHLHLLPLSSLLTINSLNQGAGSRLPNIAKVFNLGSIRDNRILVQKEDGLKHLPVVRRIVEEAIVHSSNVDEVQATTDTRDTEVARLEARRD